MAYKLATLVKIKITFGFVLRRQMAIYKASKVNGVSIRLSVSPRSFSDFWNK